MQTQSDLRRQKKKNIVFFPLAVAVWVQQQFSSKVHFKCGRSEEGPFASSLLGHEFSHVRVVPTQIRWSPNSIRQMHWDEKFVHWEIGLKFRDFEVGIPDWDCETKIYNLKFIESLLLLGEKTQEWKFRICIPPYYPVHIMVGICRLLSIFHCLLWKRCIPLRAKVPDILHCFSFRFMNCALELGRAGPKVRVRTGQLENCGSPILQEIMIWNVLVNLESGQPQCLLSSLHEINLQNMQQYEITSGLWTSRLCHEVTKSSKGLWFSTFQTRGMAAILPTNKPFRDFPMSLDLSGSGSGGLVPLRVKKKHGLLIKDTINLHDDTQIKYMNVLNVLLHFVFY